MKALLLGLTVVTCILAAESAHVDAPFLKLIKELDELRMTANNFLEHQEMSHTPLKCAGCDEHSEAACNANETEEVCGASLDRCFSVTFFDQVTMMTTVRKNCFFSSLCDAACTSLNASNNNNIQSCQSFCCNTSLCNSGNPLPTTTVTREPVTTSPPGTTAPAAVTTPPAGTTAPAAVTTPPAGTTAPAAVTTPPAGTTAPAAVTTPPAGTTAPAAVTTPPAGTTGPATATPSSSATTTTTEVVTTQPSTASPTTPVVCGGVLGQSGTIMSPNFPGDYPNGVTCVWTTTMPLPVGRRYVFGFTALALSDAGDILEFFLGPVSIRRFVGTGKRKRSLYDEPSYENVYREDEGDYYDDSDNKDYYVYDGRRKKEHYFYHRRRRRTFLTVVLNGNNQVARVVFQSNASGSSSGFRAQFAEEANGGGGGTGSSGESGGGSSDEEEI